MLAASCRTSADAGSPAAPPPATARLDRLLAAHAEALPEDTLAPGCGVVRFRERISARVPRLAYGYFNPTKERYAALAG